jgi:hypothetical protein
VARTALVGVGKLGQQQPVLVVEPIAGLTPKVDNKIGRRLIGQLLELGARYEHTRLIKDFMFHPSFPVDVRHNAKIQREKLAIWVARQRG